MNTTTTPKEEKYTIDREIERLLKEIEKLPVGSEEYLKAADTLKVMREARGVRSHSDIDINTVIAVAANIIGLLVVLNYEKTNVITTKAFGMLFRGRNG